jgi:hypothetical protein
MSIASAIAPCHGFSRTISLPSNPTLQPERPDIADASWTSTSTRSRDPSPTGAHRPNAF